MTSLPQLISEHGYWVLAVGTLLEGEAVVMLGGYAAHEGLLDLRWLFLIGAAGGWFGDQLWFWLGRHRGTAMLARWPSLADHAARGASLIHRYPHACVILVRFAYGLRIAGPILIGASRLPPLQFAVLNAIGAVIWSGALCSAGWFLGEAAQELLGRARHLEIGLLVIGGGGALVAWLVTRWLRHRRK